MVMRPEFISRTLPPFAVAASFGCVLGLYGVVHPAILFGSSGFFLLLALGMRNHSSGRVWLWAAAVGVFALRAGADLGAGSNGISRWIPRRHLFVEGILLGEPEAQAQGQGWRIVVRAKRVRVEGRIYPVSGRIAVRWPGPRPAWSRGDTIALAGRLEALPRVMNPGGQPWLRRRGVQAILRGNLPEAATRIRPAAFWHAGRVGRWLQERVLTGLTQTIRPAAQPMARAMLIGDRSLLTVRQRERMAAAGLAHVLAVSGLHAGMVFMLLAGGVALLHGPRWAAGGLGAMGVMLFAVAAGGRPPVWRSAWMVTAVAASGGAYRRHDALSVLCLAALLLLALDPLALWDCGAQLSFAATLGIVTVVPMLARLPVSGWRLWLVSSLMISFAAFLCTAPLTLFYFYSITPISLLTNLAGVPLTAVAVTTGLTAALASPVGLPAEWLGWVASLALAALEQLSTWGAMVSWGHFYLWPGTALWTLAGYGLGVFMIYGQRHWAAIGLTIWLGAYPFFRPLLPPADKTYAVFFSLAVGEATWLETGSGYRVLSDTGTEAEFLGKVKPFLAQRGVRRIDALVVSHSDADHAGGVLACCQFFQVKQLITPESTCFQPPGKKSYRTGDDLRLGRDGRLVILWPPAGGPVKGNDGSLVALAECHGRSLVLTGDISQTVEEQIVWPKVDVLKIPHHGSLTSSSETLLYQVQPSHAVVMSGSRNAFGFPHPAIMRRLKRHVPQVVDTGERGAVEFLIGTGQPIGWWTWSKRFEPD